MYQAETISETFIHGSTLTLLPVLYESTLFQVEFYSEECVYANDVWKDLGTIEDCDFLHHIKNLQVWITIDKVNDEHERIAVEGSHCWPTGNTAEMAKVFVDMIVSEVEDQMVACHMSVVYDGWTDEEDVVEILRGFKGLRSKEKFRVDVLFEASEEIEEVIGEIGGFLMEE